MCDNFGKISLFNEDLLKNLIIELQCLKVIVIHKITLWTVANERMVLMINCGVRAGRTVRQQS